MTKIAADRRTMLFGAALTAVATVAFSGKAVIVKLAYRHGVDTITLLALRMLFAAPLFLALGWWASRRQRVKPLTRREWLTMAGLGLLGYYAASLFDFLGLQYISAALERLVLFLYPTFVVLFSALLFRHRITRRELLALAISYAGIALVFINDLTTQQANVTLGMVLVLISALCYAGYLIGSGRLVQRVGSVRFACFASLAASVGVLTHFIIVRDIAVLIEQPLPVHGLALLMAVVSTVLPIVLTSEGIRLLGSNKVAMVGTLGPVATIFLGYVFLNEPITTVQLAGAALVVAGVLVIALRGTAGARKSEPIGA
ncbi:MAG TPA: DMT family transporter [Burkholderiaceae bacterium]|nr:DMT family transporter [Burkholderiaceae bacterium]